ncbi:GNAT family N-acetyltransferase [Aspergillus lucknowensis]|uniref:N-acetyltransferase domain-containing protein n=1 Tax=Aspergillus lucknowensis TaxID=176173 RepID=A0ABR4LF88_9EURO
MSESNYTTTTFNDSYISETSELLFNAKLGLTINRLLFKNWPNEAIQRKNYRAVLENLDRSKTEALSVVDNASGEVVAHLSITRKQPLAKRGQNILSSNEDKEQTKDAEVPEYFNPVVLSAVQSAVAELARGLGDIDHLELTYIIVKPEHRGCGIGIRLMELVFSKAEALGLPVALSSEPQVYDFFIKRGFKDTKYVDFDLAKWAPPYSGFGMFRLAGLIWYPKIGGYT